MKVTSEHHVSRRTAIFGGLGTAAGLSLAAGIRSASAAPTIQSGGGAAGGGSISTIKATAHFSLFASRFKVDGESDPLIVGQVRWKDDAGFGFESISVDTYGPIDGDDKNARALTGTAKLDNGAQQMFTMRIVDRSGPGTGKDEIELTVGPGDNHIYDIKGTLATGDIELLTFDFSD
jgi:hypothetical protein